MALGLAAFPVSQEPRDSSYTIFAPMSDSNQCA